MLGEVGDVSEAIARLSNQLGGNSAATMGQKRFDLLWPVVSSRAHGSLARRVVRSVMFFLSSKKVHRDHTTRHRLGVERPPTTEKTH